MSSDKAAESPRDPGRPQKRLDPDAGPVPLLAQALRDLRDASGNPTYRTLQRYAGVPHQRLADAARGEQLPPWPVVQGYLHGCQAYHQYKHKGQPTLDGASDLLRWRRLYRDAGGTLPEEGQFDGEGVLDTTPAIPARSRPLRTPPQQTQLFFERTQPAGNHRHRTLLLKVAGAVGIVLLSGAGIMLDVSLHSRPPSLATKFDAPAGHTTAISVPAPAPACGDAAEDGFRSPATTSFGSIKTSYTLTLDGLSADLMEATYDGISYQWVEAHPTGSRAGMQLRWAPAQGQWHYCTATLEAGNISALPDLVGTTAVPAIIHGRNVIYQACIWHQNPYTARCSPLVAATRQ
jgi:hypothetical protein